MAKYTPERTGAARVRHRFQADSLQYADALMLQLKKSTEKSQRIAGAVPDPGRADNSPEGLPHFAAKRQRQRLPTRTLKGIPYVCLRIPTGGGNTCSPPIYETHGAPIWSRIIR